MVEKPRQDRPEWLNAQRRSRSTKPDIPAATWQTTFLAGGKSRPQKRGSASIEEASAEEPGAHGLTANDRDARLLYPLHVQVLRGLKS